MDLYQDVNLLNIRNIKRYKLCALGYITIIIDNTISRFTLYKYSSKSVKPYAYLYTSTY